MRHSRIKNVGFQEIKIPDQKRLVGNRSFLINNTLENPGQFSNKKIASRRPHARPDSQNILMEVDKGVHSTILRIWDKNVRIRGSPYTTERHCPPRGLLSRFCMSKLDIFAVIVYFSRFTSSGSQAPKDKSS